MITVAAAIVSYFSDSLLLTRTIEQLCQSAAFAHCAVHLTVVDNSEHRADAPRLRELLDTWQTQLAQQSALTVELKHLESNPGYGAANNHALIHGNSEFVLVLNPDAEIEQASLRDGLAVLESDTECVLVTPRALSPEGQDLFLGHGYPSVAALAGRASPILRRIQFFRRSMDHYELRHLDPNKAHDAVICASGCFMLIPRRAWEIVGGFDPRYFLYFEDYDLSVRLRRIGKVRYEPRVRLNHAGGDAAGKGWAHKAYFIKSAARFFHQHGLRWL